MNEYDFSGWATRNNIECSDGRVIMKDAFKQNDGQKVPLVWNHQHDDPNEVLGHALLENREEGVYAYCKFNDTDSGRTAKALVVNGDVDKLSIYANKLKSQMNKVVHGCIREVSLVLAGANPGAFIDSVITHSDESGDEEEGVIYTDEPINIAGDDKPVESDDSVKDDQGKGGEGEVSEDDKVKEPVEDAKETPATEEPSEKEETPAAENPAESTPAESGDAVEHSDDNSKTIDDVMNTLSEDQKKVVYSAIGQIKENGKLSDEKEFKHAFDAFTNDQKDAVYALIGKALEKDDDKNKESEGEKNIMKHNVFENDNNNQEEVLAHAAIVSDAIKDAKKYGSMRESFIAHAAANGFDHVDYLFPDAKELNVPPVVVRPDETWVGKVMNTVHHSPFSRVKSTFATLSEEDARARGYIKGNQKKDFVMQLLKRSTTPTTVYIKSTIDRDDVIDITDFDVVAFQKREMRKQLDKELALAILIGDGRSGASDDKINEQNIRPIMTDDDFYAIKYEVKDGKDYDSVKNGDSRAKGFIRSCVKARKEYKGSGRPTLFTTEDLLTEMLLIEDVNGRVIYDSEEKLATALRVKEIVTVPEFEGRFKDGDTKKQPLLGIIVNLADYNAGADKGGNVGMFDDFDIDYNQMKYLMETRMSGALVTPYSAIVLYESKNQ